MAPSTTGTNSESEGGFFECAPDMEDDDYHSLYSGSSVSANSLTALQRILNASNSTSERSSARSITSDSDTNVSMYGNDFMVGIDTTEEYTTDQTDTDLDETQKTEFTRNTDDAVCSDYGDSDYENVQKMSREEFQRDIENHMFKPSPVRSPGKSLMSGSLVNRSQLDYSSSDKQQVVSASVKGSLMSGTIDDLDDLSEMDYKILADSLMSGDIMSISSSDGDGTVSSFNSAFSDMTKLRSLLRGEMPTSTTIHGSDSEHSSSVPSSRVISPMTVDGHVSPALDKVQEIDDEKDDSVSHQSYASESIEAAAARMIEESMQKIKAEEKAQNWVTKLKADRENTLHEKAEMDALLKIIDDSKQKSEVKIPLQADVKATITKKSDASNSVDEANFGAHGTDVDDNDEETVYTAQEFEHESENERLKRWEVARRLAEEEGGKERKEENHDTENTEIIKETSSSNKTVDQDALLKDPNPDLSETAKAAALRELQLLKQKKEKRLDRKDRKKKNKKQKKGASIAAEEEAQRLKEEEASIAAEAKAQRLKEEEDARIAAELEAQRLKEEEEARIAAELEAQRLKEEEEARIQAQRLKEEEEARIAAEAEAQRLKEEEDARIAAEFQRLAIEQASIDDVRRKEEENALRLAEEEKFGLNEVFDESERSNNLDSSFQTAEMDIDQDNDLTFLSQSTGNDCDDSVLEEQARYEEEADELRMLTESFSSNSTPTRAKNDRLKIKVMEDEAPHESSKPDMALVSPNTQPTVDDGISLNSPASVSTPGKNYPPTPAEPVKCGCCVIS